MEISFFPAVKGTVLSHMTGLTPPTLHEVSDVIHCHSTYSDGMEPIDVIARAANRSGLRFLIMTDHDTLAPVAKIGEQWFGDTLLLLGCEITPRHNHYLAYGIRETIRPRLPPPTYTAAVAAQGGIGFLGGNLGRVGPPGVATLKDGEMLQETTDCDLQSVDTGPGEAYKRGRGWIFSNPNYLRSRSSDSRGEG